MYQLQLLEAASNRLEDLLACRRDDYPPHDGMYDTVTAELVAAKLVCPWHVHTTLDNQGNCAVCQVELPEEPREAEWVRRARAGALPARVSYRP